MPCTICVQWWLTISFAQAVRTLLSKVEALQHEKHLIIDDEYDAATITDPDMLARRRVTAVGAQTNVEDSVPQAISRIRLLAADTNNAGYAGYTATSFAVMLMNRTKYEALNLRVVPQNCWVLEQHPNTKTYVGLQQIFGRREKHRVLQIVDEKEYVQWEKFAVSTTATLGWGSVLGVVHTSPATMLSAPCHNDCNIS